MKLKFLASVAAGACLAAIPAVVCAQATRTWVSGVGDDANPCSRTAPCKTFAGAISKTATQGEINCLDPGGFGTLTITKAIAIKCDNVLAGVLASGTSGMVINASGADVYLSGLDFEGAGSSASSTSPNAVSILTARSVHIVNSTIRGFQNGVNVANSSAGVHVDVVGTVISDNSAAGILVKPTGSFGNRVSVSNSTVSNNGGDGIKADASATSAQVKMSISNSNLWHNGGSGVLANSSGSAAWVQVESSTAYDNSVGINATGSGAIVRVIRSTISGNGTGVSATSSGQALSYGDNALDGNGTDGTFGTATPH